MFDPKTYIFDVSEGDPKDWYLPKDAILIQKTKQKTNIIFPNLSRRRVIPPVINQGSIGSCVGCSGYIVFGNTDNNKDILLSAMWIYKRGKEFDEFKGVDYTGTSISGACKALKQVGCCLVSYYPYMSTENVEPAEGAFKDAEKRKIFAYYKIELNRTDEIKKLLNDECLWVAFNVHENFFLTGKDGKVKSENYINGKKYGGHAVAIIGYETNFGDNKLWWECRNSWGEGWGNEGNFYIEDDLLKKIIIGNGVYYLVTAEEEAKRLQDLKDAEFSYKENKKHKFPWNIIEWFKKLFRI